MGLREKTAYMSFQWGEEKQGGAQTWVNTKVRSSALTLLHVDG